MPELVAEPFLDNVSIDLGTVKLTEETGISIVSLATPLGGDKALTAAIKSAWDCGAPSPVKSAAKGDVRLIRTSPDQILALMSRVDGLAAPDVAEALGGAAYVTEQTDNWVALRIEGPQTLPALERICPLDLETWSANQAARTVMEHIGAIILKEKKDGFLLLSASSSARSFLHAVELSMRNVT